MNKEGEYEIARFPDGTIRWALANQSPGWDWVNTGFVAPLNQWSHVVVTYDGGLAKTYADGQLVHTHQGAGAVGAVFTAQNDFRIGGRQASAQFFQGRLDEVRVYDRALSAGEVSALAGPTTAGLVGHWKFDEGAGAAAADSSGSGNAGSLQSGAGWGAGQSGAAVALAVRRRITSHFVARSKKFDGKFCCNLSRSALLSRLWASPPHSAARKTHYCLAATRQLAPAKLVSS